MASLERQCWRNAQYSRRECVEMIISILHSIVHSDLEKIVCKVLQHTGDDICGEKIELCECLNQKSHRAIVRFSKWKDWTGDEGQERFKRFKFLTPTDLDFPERTRLFINDSLCHYYRGVWNECKKLWINKKIFSFFTINGTVQLKFKQDGSCNSITHLDDLKSLFPEENFTMSSL